MGEQQFREWLALKSWGQAVRYCKAVACLLPPAALAADAPHLRDGTLLTTPGLPWLLGWQVMAEAVCVAMVLADRWLPQLRGREWPLYVFSTVFLAMSVWVGMADSVVRGDLSLYAAGSTFIASVICTPRAVRRPIYALGLLALAVPAWDRAADLPALIAALVNPFCVVVLCIELDKFTYARNVELYAETQRAEAERRRADAVLSNVLPVAIADELKHKGCVDAVKFENMGVMFADIVGFTTFSRNLPPDALVFVLNQIFSTFDALVEQHGLEKIKTLGDGYMVVSHHRVDGLCQLALDMSAAMARYNQANGTELSLRIGIHTGPAVAGVIGVKRFLYDVWGDTVNVASRMEASGAPGVVHVSEAVHQQTRHIFAFEARPPIDIKGRGLMSTYWLLGPRAMTGRNISRTEVENESACPSLS